MKLGDDDEHDGPDPDPDLVAALTAALTLWASPGLLTDPAQPDLAPVAVLALVPSITALTSDEHPGADLIDVIISSLLRSGFGLLTRVDLAELGALPVPAGWHAQLDHDGRQMRITEPDGTLYDGDLGPAPLPGWHDALRRRGYLAVLVGTTVDIGAADRADRIDEAARAGRLVGAQIPASTATLP